MSNLEKFIILLSKLSEEDKKIVKEFLIVLKETKETSKQTSDPQKEAN